jgi:hypothetical protein
MTPKQHRTRAGDKASARSRRQVAEKFLDAAELIGSEDGAAINVCVSNAILAGIAAGDAICIAAIGERYSGPDHTAAADFLRQVDLELGKRLRVLVGLKNAAHYGDHLLSAGDRDLALRQATALVTAARDRTL